MIRNISSDTDGDADQVVRIYNHYIANTVATFETVPIDAAEMLARIRRVDDAGLSWLVATEPDASVGITGYAYATAWKPRQAYARTVETTVYVAPENHRQGVGKALMAALLDELENRDIHCALAGISLPNDASVRLHESLGFSHSGTLREVGWKLDRWIDVGYWQKVLAGSS